MTEKISLLLVDDQPLLREGMRVILELEEDITVIGEAENGQEAIALYGELRPDVVLMDIRMPVMNGIDAIQSICSSDPSAKIIILTTFDNDDYIFDGIRAGALGYVLKAITSDRLIDAVRGVYRGESLLEASVARKIIASVPRSAPVSGGGGLAEPLGERELEILRLMETGLRNRRIATQLHLAEGTVKIHLHRAVKRLQTLLRPLWENNEI